MTGATSAHSYGFAAFDLDPGSRPGDFTSITYYDVVGPDGLAPFGTFTLRRPAATKREMGWLLMSVLGRSEHR